jgi:hypothetical protein
MPEKIHAHHKHNGVYNAGDQDPFPQPVLPDEFMGFEISLYGYDDFFEQHLHLGGKYIEVVFSFARKHFLRRAVGTTGVSFGLNGKITGCFLWGRRCGADCACVAG